MDDSSATDVSETDFINAKAFLNKKINDNEPSL